MRVIFLWDVVFLTLTRGANLTRLGLVVGEIIVVVLVVGDDVDVHFIDDGISPGNIRTDDGFLDCLDFKGGGRGGDGREQLDGRNIVAVMVMMVMIMR